MADMPESIENPKRRSKVLESEEAVALLPPEVRVVVGGRHAHAQRTYGLGTRVHSARQALRDAVRRAFFLIGC